MLSFNSFWNIDPSFNHIFESSLWTFVSLLLYKEMLIQRVIEQQKRKSTCMLHSIHFDLSRPRLIFLNRKKTKETKIGININRGCRPEIWKNNLNFHRNEISFMFFVKWDKSQFEQWALAWFKMIIFGNLLFQCVKQFLLHRQHDWCDKR